MRLYVATIAFLLFASPAVASSIVRFSTPLGDIDVRLFNEATPASVDNFLDLIDLGVFEQTIFSRSVPNFVIQGGGFRVNANDNLEVSPGPPVDNLVPDSEGNLTGILNEPGLANVRGTIAFARGSEVDSATNQFFFNTANNRGTAPLGLDFQNEGFTAFGQVISGLDVVDQIAALPAADLSTVFGTDAFSDTPIIGIEDLDGNGRITPSETGGPPPAIENFFALDVTRTTFDTADFNLDGVVDVDDFEFFRSQFGNSLHISDLNSNPSLGTALDSDASGDAIINAADFVVFRDSVTTGSLPVSAATAPAIGVPEPATLGGLATLLFLTAGATRRRR